MGAKVSKETLRKLALCVIGTFLVGLLSYTALFPVHGSPDSLRLLGAILAALFGYVFTGQMDLVGTIPGHGAKLSIKAAGGFALFALVWMGWKFLPTAPIPNGPPSRPTQELVKNISVFRGKLRELRDSYALVIEPLADTDGANLQELARKDLEILETSLADRLDEAMNGFGIWRPKLGIPEGFQRYCAYAVSAEGQGQELRAWRVARDLLSRAVMESGYSPKEIESQHLIPNSDNSCPCPSFVTPTGADSRCYAWFMDFPSGR